jgi:hypothetical protein
MIDIYDSELPKIGKVSQDLNTKWNYLARRLDGATGSKLIDAINIFSKEVQGRFQEIGFIAEVNVAPIYMDRPPEITIVDRIVKQEFDHERKGYEIKTGRN